MSIESIEEVPRSERAQPFGTYRERDVAVLHAALGGMLLVSLEPALAMPATEPTGRNPASISLFPPPNRHRKSSAEKPISDLGLARFDQPQIVVGLAKQLREVLEQPHRLQKRGFVAFIPEETNQDSQWVTTQVLSVVTRPLDPRVAIRRHRLVLSEAPRSGLASESPFTANTDIVTSELLETDTTLVYRALSSLIGRRQHDHTFLRTATPESPQTEVCSNKSAVATSAWRSLARKRSKR